MTICSGVTVGSVEPFKERRVQYSLTPSCLKMFQALRPVHLLSITSDDYYVRPNMLEICLQLILAGPQSIIS